MQDPTTPALLSEDEINSIERSIARRSFVRMPEAGQVAISRLLASHRAQAQEVERLTKERDKMAALTAPQAQQAPQVRAARAGELVAILLGPDGEDGADGRLGWLGALLIDLRDRLTEDKAFCAAWEGDDPSAAWEALREAEALRTELRDWLTKARAAAPLPAQPEGGERDR